MVWYQNGLVATAARGSPVFDSVVTCGARHYQRLDPRTGGRMVTQGHDHLGVLEPQSCLLEAGVRLDPVHDA